jgi:hypothetical protein
MTSLTRRIIVTSLLVGNILAGVFSATTVAAVEIGDRAPDFELPATTGGTIKLSEFSGKKAVLIEFYGADFAPV